MLRYTLIFLFINSYGRSLGLPVREESSNGRKIIISDLLSNLSKQCKNEFVVAQVQSKIAKCNVELSYQEVPMQCLMFYDANQALCNITSVGAADLTKDFKAKIIEKQNVTKFCSEAANFTLPAAMVNRENIYIVFHSVVACTKVCTEEDITTGQTNFYCKYYKWALSKLDAAANLTQVLNSTVRSADSGASNVAEEENDAVVHVSESAGGQLNVHSDKVQTQSRQSHDPNEHPSEAARHESSSLLPLTSQQNQESSLQLQIGTNTSINRSTEVPPPKEGDGAPVLERINSDGGPVGGGNDGAGQGNSAGAQERGALGSDDDAEDDDRDENLETGGEDGEDINIDPLLNKHQGRQEAENKIETQFAEVSQRDFSQNASGFTEDDDHFFPFFLTAVIFVVVLYILYHNKSKVGKLIFGLIVEGRQTGRRRNSRGHAYRRLDTLEQAMSANTAAPPSKIIY